METIIDNAGIIQIPTENVVTDVYGNQLKAGDFLIYATKCTNSAYLRRGIIKSIIPIPFTTYNGNGFTIKVKSIIPELKYGKWLWDGKKGEHIPWCRTGNTSFDVYSKNNIFKFNDVMKIFGDFEHIFTSEEQELIKKHNIKLNYGN